LQIGYKPLIPEEGIEIMATGSKGPENLTGTREGESVSRRGALGALGILGLTGLLAVTAACSNDDPKPARNQQQKPMPPEHPSHDTSQGVVTCDRKKGLIRVVDPKEAQRDPQRYSLRPEDCREGGAPSNVDPLPPAAPASPTNTPPAGK
jgi:hypothetical protein